MSSSLRSVPPRRSTAVGVFLLLKHFAFGPLEVRGGIKSNLTDSTLLRRLHIQEVRGAMRRPGGAGPSEGRPPHTWRQGARPRQIPRVRPLSTTSLMFSFSLPPGDAKPRKRPREHEILPCSTTRVDLEVIVLHEISQRKSRETYDFARMWDVKLNATNEHDR